MRERTRYKNNSTMLNLAKAHGNYRTDLRTEFYSQKFKFENFSIENIYPIYEQLYTDLLGSNHF